MAVSAEATSPPVQDSARATVARVARHAAWRRSASWTSGSSSTLLVLGQGRRGRRLEQPGFGDPALAERSEGLAVQREERDTGRARAHLDGALAGKRQDLAIVERPAGAAHSRVQLAVDPDLHPGVAALDRDRQV